MANKTQNGSKKRDQASDLDLGLESSTTRNQGYSNVEKGVERKNVGNDPLS